MPLRSASFGWCASLLCACLAFPALGGSAKPAASRRDEALRTAHTPRAAAALVELEEEWDDASDLGPYATVLEGIRRRKDADPRVRDLATQQLAALRRARGETEAARALQLELGFLDRFYVLGPFDNEGKAGCGTEVGVEGVHLDLKKAHPAKLRDVTWRKLPATRPDGYVDLSSFVQPNDEVAAYALTFLEAPAPGVATFGIGSSGGFRLWVNGALVAQSDDYNYPRPDQRRVSVPLSAGMNRVLLKVCQERGPLGFYLRQTGARAEAKLPEAAPPLPTGALGAPKPALTAAQSLEQALSQRPNDAALRADWARLLHATRAYDERERTAATQAQRAALQAPQDVGIRLLAARLQSDDLNLRREHLEEALRLAPGSPQVRVALARHELALDHPERALPLLEALGPQAADRSAEVALALARTWEELGELPRAVRRIERAAAQRPTHPPLLRELARYARRLDRNAQAVATLRALLKVRHDDRGARRALGGLLADQGDVTGAAAELEALLAQDPTDNAARLSLAELLAANGRMEDARAHFERAKALAPEDPDLYEREGRALLYAGARPQAVAAFRQALALRPQNPGLKEALRSLEGEAPPGGTEHVVDWKPLLAQVDPKEDAVYLADYTYVRVLPSGQSSRFQQLAVKVGSTRGVDAFRSLPLTYAPSRQEVRVLRARVVKPDGSVVEGAAENERSLNEPWTGMYYDARAKVLTFPALGVGDVLEVWWRLEDIAQENLLSDYWGDVELVQTTHPKLRYRYLVEMPKGRKLFTHLEARGVPLAASEEPLDEGRRLYRWESQSVPKVVPEPLMPGWVEVAAYLHASTYETWEQVGRYYWGLVRDQLVPSDELRRTVERELQGVNRKDPRAVVNALYGFVVTNTRYVALEFGIHGYKPYRVDRVLARRFGDCKDKASLLHALLQVAGIDSRLVLLRMRHLGQLAPTPASLSAFNHAILYVPSMDLYLDGTAEYHGSSEVPLADQLASVLVVEPGGKSELRTVPESTSKDNRTELTLNVTLRLDGSADARGTSRVTGQSAPGTRRAYQAATTRKTTFEQSWAAHFPGLSAHQVELASATQLEQPVELRFAFEVPRYAEAIPGALRLYPFGGQQTFAQSYAQLARRAHDLVLAAPWTQAYHFTYRLPPDLSLAELPPVFEERTPFGHARLKVWMEGGLLHAQGEVSFTTSRVSRRDYGAFRAWLTRLDQAFSRRVLIRQARSAKAL